MIRLWVDDERPAPDSTWTVAKSVHEAQQVLANEVVTDLALDHDLGVCWDCEQSRCVNSSDPKWNRYWVESSKPFPGYEDCFCRCHKTGYDLIKWIAETDHWSINKPSCHSDNPPGKANIIATIDRYGPYSPSRRIHPKVKSG